MRIGLFGQAPFGAAVYERLRERGHSIVGVYGPMEKSKPDPLAEAARRDGVTLVQPTRWQRKGNTDEEAFKGYAVVGAPDQHHQRQQSQNAVRHAKGR